MVAVRVEMVADVVCPFCYIGWKHLRDAVEKSTEMGLPVTITTTYTPFILRRHLPKQGVDKVSVFTKMLGSEAQAYAKLNGIKQAAESAGLCFDTTGQRSGNSEDAHRLILWARRSGKELELFESMVKAYNCERGWLGDHDVLAKCAASVGLSEVDARQVLADQHEASDDLENGLKRSEKMGVSGVPFFVINDSKVIPGSVPADSFLQIFQAAADGRL
mmetsp:Transcript_139244/g.277633  ORF Transcript_139244/g.277633 Transcript_139244/m.277633 type:complete len:218 (+) Transcript_139244:90-743(+)